jgi:hypothetical protein
MLGATMWGFGGSNVSTREPASGLLPPSSPSKSAQKKRLRNTAAKKHVAGDNPRSPQSQASSKTKGSLSIAFSEESLSVSETMNGVEVALDWDAASTPRRGSGSSLNRDIRQATKVHRYQFSMNYPVLKGTGKSAGKRKISQQQHRVPLEPQIDTSSLQDFIFLLQAHSVRDEISSVQEELARLDAEIQALEEDRMEIEHEYLRIPASKDDDEASWDINHVLKQKPDLSSELQDLRGSSWTIQLNSKKARDSLCSKLGTATQSKYKARVSVTAKHVCHMNLLPNAKGATAFYFHTDAAESQGHIPTKLFNRMKKHALQIEMLQYLATGPCGSYYAAFSSGHVWWAGGDDDFSDIVSEWPVYRVAFGPALLTKKVKIYSWVVVSRDGRVAFKNLPTRLQHLLESRLANEAAPAELSLGTEGSYFCRFLDGSVDYCLPAVAAQVCDEIVSKGGKITNILLHPLLSREFIVRHSELKLKQKK